MTKKNKTKVSKVPENGRKSAEFVVKARVLITAACG